MADHTNATTVDPGGPNPGQRPGRGNNRGDRGQQKWNRNKQSKYNFTGKIKEMNGHVFQLRVEQKKRTVSGNNGTTTGACIISLQE